MAIDQRASLVKAYIRLKGLRDNIPSMEWVPSVLADDFNQALNDLKAADHDLSDFAIKPSEVHETWSGDAVLGSVLKARLDAVLTYFQINLGEEKAQVGFRAPK
jgi:hypothetical protein